MKMAVAAQHNFEIAAIFMFCGVQPDMKTYYEREFTCSLRARCVAHYERKPAHYIGRNENDASVVLKEAPFSLSVRSERTAPDGFARAT